MKQHTGESNDGWSYAVEKRNRDSAGPSTHHRRHGRILAMQALSQLDVQGDDFMADIEGFFRNADLAAGGRRYAQKIVDRAWPDRAELDRRLSEVMDHWSADRISLVERNVMRVAVVELDDGEVPAKVTINEAIDIAREYGGKESPAFINGVLDSVWKRTRAENEPEGDG